MAVTIYFIKFSRHMQKKFLFPKFLKLIHTNYKFKKMVFKNC